MTADDALAAFDDAEDYDSKVAVFAEFMADELAVKEKLKRRDKIEFKGGAIKRDRLHRYDFQRSSPDQPVVAGGYANPPTRVIRIINCGSEWVS